MTRNSILACFSIAAFALVGCGSSDSGGGSPDAGTTPYGLSGGDNCYTITAIAQGYSDGCMIGVDTLVGLSLPMNYNTSTYFVTLGTGGSLGGGAIAYNTGTLNREGDTAFSATCTLHQRDTTVLQMLDNDKFTVSVTEEQSNFAPTCGTDSPTDGVACTSTWTWTMEKSNVATLIPPACGS